MKEVDSKWTREFFNQKFDELISRGINYQDAYWRLEEEHHRLFGATRYAYYDSFRLARRKLIKCKPDTKQRGLVK